MLKATNGQIRRLRKWRSSPPKGNDPALQPSLPLKKGLREGHSHVEERHRDQKRRSKSFQLPTAASRPGIRSQLRRASKGIAARFFQFLSGHAMIAPFLREMGVDGDRRLLVVQQRQAEQRTPIQGMQGLDDGD